MNIKSLLKHRLVENFISLGVIQGINYLLPLITIPFLFNQLGVERYGLVNFAFAFIQYFLVLTDFGFGLSGTRYIAEHRDNHNTINRFLNSANIARAILTFVSFLAVIICVFAIPALKPHKLFIFLFFGQVIGNALNPVWFFQGMEKMKFNTILHITTRLISILPLFIIVRQPDDYIYIPIFYSFGAIIAGIMSLIFIHHSFGMKFYFTSIHEIWLTIFESSKFFLSRLSVSLYTNTNSFVLGLVCGNSAVGYYSLAEKIYVALNSVYGPINGAIFPYMTKERNLKLFKKILGYGIILNGLMLIAFYLIFPYISPYVFDNFAYESFNVMSILIFSNFVCLPGTFLGYPFLAAWGHPNFCNYSIVASSLFHLCGLGILYLTDNVSIYSVAYMVVACEAFLLAYRIYGVKKYHLWKN